MLEMAPKGMKVRLGKGSAVHSVLVFLNHSGSGNVTCSFGVSSASSDADGAGGFEAGKRWWPTLVGADRPVHPPSRPPAQALRLALAPVQLGLLWKARPPTPRPQALQMHCPKRPTGQPTLGAHSAGRTPVAAAGTGSAVAVGEERWGDRGQHSGCRDRPDPTHWDHAAAGFPWVGLPTGLVEGVGAADCSAEGEGQTTAGIGTVSSVCVAARWAGWLVQTVVPEQLVPGVEGWRRRVRIGMRVDPRSQHLQWVQTQNPLAQLL
mmetsp:Transcript_17709/g.23337  ORF Transcript_17709/g.23337 Transcript_17709/m.23337 type:complete len:264 (+) Transcript_17709:564-1355(+)